MLKRFDAVFVTKSVYGLVNVLVILLVMEDHPPTAFEGAVTLFGATLAIALVEAYAEVVGETIGHQRRLTGAELQHIRRVVTPVLIGAQAPTVVLLLSALGLFSVETAISLGQLIAVLLLAAFGVRAIVVQHKEPFRRLVSGLMMLGLGLLTVLLKAAFH